MKVCRAVLRPYRLPLVRPLATAHGPISERQGWIVRLEDESGHVGLGEACPLPDFGTETLDECEGALRYGLATRAPTLDAIRSEWPAAGGRGAPCARAALESAIVDLSARRAALSMADWLSRDEENSSPSRKRVEVQALVGGASPDEVAESARAARIRGHRVFKLKLAVSPGDPSIEFDLDRIEALRDVVGAESRIRLDANEAWTEAEAQAALQKLSDRRIEYVEQPVHRDDLDALLRLRDESPVKVAADEALLGAGLAACLEREAARILIVKPAALGGVALARDLARVARERGLRVIWSTLLDGAVSRASVLALAALGSMPDEVHGIATGPLLKEDFSGEATIESGAIAPQAGPGLGFEVDLEGDAPYWLGPQIEVELLR